MWMNRSNAQAVYLEQLKMHPCQFDNWSFSRAEPFYDGYTLSRIFLQESINAWPASVDCAESRLGLEVVVVS